MPMSRLPRVAWLPLVAALLVFVTAYPCTTLAGVGEEATQQPAVSAATGDGSGGSPTASSPLFGPQERTEADDDDDGPTGLRKLTKEEVSRIRYLELRGMRLGRAASRPDRVIVKIPKETTEDFLKEMEGHEDWQGDVTRREFHKLTAPQKLHQIAIYKGAKYADRVRIMSDPEVFVAFRQNVMPTAVRSCGTPGCHLYDPQRPRPFQLFSDPTKTEATTYANFIMLCEMEVNGQRLIDRAKPDESLLLTYLLPVKDVEPALRHAATPGPKTIYRTRKAMGYRQIQKWISSLKHPAEDYGVRFTRPPPARASDNEDGEGDRPDESSPPRKPAEGDETPTSGPTSEPDGAGGAPSPA